MGIGTTHKAFHREEEWNVEGKEAQWKESTFNNCENKKMGLQQRICQNVGLGQGNTGLRSRYGSVV